MAPILSFLISSWSKKKKPRYVCLSEAKASHSHKMWTDVSSSVLHFLQMGLLLSPIIYKCLPKVLCPVSRPITTLDCVLLKDNYRALVARSGPEINSQACLCVLQGPSHITRCWISVEHFIFLLIFCLETAKKGSGPTDCWIEPSLVSWLGLGIFSVAYFFNTLHCNCYGLLWDTCCLVHIEPPFTAKVLYATCNCGQSCNCGGYCSDHKCLVLIMLLWCAVFCVVPISQNALERCL